MDQKPLEFKLTLVAFLLTLMVLLYIFVEVNF
jgi:hypothetical protein